MVVSPQMSETSVGSPQYQTVNCGSISPNQSLGSPNYQQVPSPTGQMVPSPGSVDTKPQINYQITNQHQSMNNIQQQIFLQNQQQNMFQETQSQQQMGKEFINNQSLINNQSQFLQNQYDTQSGYQQMLVNNNNQDVVIKNDDDLFSDLLNMNNSNGDINTNMTTVDMLDMAEEIMKKFSSNEETSFLTTDSAGKKKKSPSSEKETDIDSLDKQMSKLNVQDKIPPSEKTNKKVIEVVPKKQSHMKEANLDIAFKVALRAAECLQDYAATGNIGLLLATHRYLLAVQNDQGDNALHTAVSNKNWEAFNTILKASEKLKPLELLNASNYAKETALHIAVRVNEPAMVGCLVSTTGCDISIPDLAGNTPLHLAAAMSHNLCLDALLFKPVNGKKDTISQAINSYNFNGETPLHLAARSGNVKSIKQLLSYGAQEHACERKRGANSLHLSVMFGRHDTAEYLLCNTGITVNAGMFDGNTALHIAAQAKDQKMCRILMAANADPFAKNLLQRRKQQSESDDEDDEDDDQEEQQINKESKKEDQSEKKNDEKKNSLKNEQVEEPDSYTPCDYAGKDKQILDILLGQSNEECSTYSSTKDSNKSSTSSSVNKLDTSYQATDSGIDISV